MTKCIIILSHKLTEIQLSELAAEGLEPVYLPENLQKAASNINPEWDEYEVMENLTKQIVEFLEKEKIMVGVIGGELTFVSQILAKTKKMNMWTPTEKKEFFCHKYYDISWLTATTKRVSKEVGNSDGTTTKTSVFEHCKFRTIA